VKHSIRRRADRARSSMPQQAARSASFRARRRLEPPLRRPLARRRAVNRRLHYAFTRRAWPARALDLLTGAVSTRWAVQLLTSSDHAHTTVVSTRSASDRLEAPSADALVDCSDRRVCGCLDSWSIAPTDEFVGVWIPSRKKQRPTTRGCPIVAASPVGDHVTANSDPANRLSEHGTVVVESA
jgi:hypothetical protein